MYEFSAKKTHRMFLDTALLLKQKVGICERVGKEALLDNLPFEMSNYKVGEPPEFHFAYKA